jgi:tetratricopeptide (TPR) repeat protein
MRPVSADLLLGAVLVLVIFAAYLPVLDAGFIWDDDGYLTRNPLVLANDGLRRIWFTTEGKDYYPLTYTSLWLQWRLWGEDPTPYHVLNVVQHALASLLLWRALAAARIPGAWICSLLFAVHPLNVESVAWIAQQKNTLALLLFLGSTWAFTRHLDARGPASYWVSVGLFVLSLLAKPLAVFWPLLIPIYAAWHARGFGRRHLTASLPFLLVSAVSGVVTIAFQHAHSLGDLEVAGDGLIARVAHAAGAWLFYLSKALAPIDLCAIYPPSAIALDRPAFWLIALAVIGVLWGLHVRRKGLAALLAVGFYTAMLLPVSGLFAVGYLFYAPVADHWAYAALIAVVAAVVSPAAAWVSHPRSGPHARQVGIVVTALLALLFSISTHERSRVFRDEQTLFGDTLVRNPGSWAAHTILGTLAFERGELGPAESHFEKALRLEPGYWEALHGLGVVYATRGQPARAIPLFEEVLRLRPGHTYARANLERARDALRRRRRAGRAGSRARSR